VSSEAALVVDAILNLLEARARLMRAPMDGMPVHPSVQTRLEKQRVDAIANFERCARKLEDVIDRVLLPGGTP